MEFRSAARRVESRTLLTDVTDGRDAHKGLGSAALPPERTAVRFRRTTKKISARRVAVERARWRLKLLSQAIAVASAGMQASTVLAHPCPANPVHGAKTTTCFVAD